MTAQQALELQDWADISRAGFLSSQQYQLEKCWFFLIHHRFRGVFVRAQKTPIEYATSMLIHNRHRGSIELKLKPKGLERG